MASASNPKLPPHNIDAERSILGGILIDPQALVQVIDRVDPSDFYRQDHQLIYQTMIGLFEQSKPVDVVTLVDRLEKAKALELAGGASYIAELTAKTASSANIVSHAQIVREGAIMRKLISAGSKIVEMGFDQENEPAEILDEAERTLFGVSQKALKDSFVPVTDILTETFERIDDLHKNKGKLRGVATGFSQLDNILSGLQNSDLVILASRPGMGKSSMALNIATSAALKQKIPVGVFSLEMSKDQLVDRLLVATAGVDSWKLRTGNLSQEDFPKIGNAMGILSEAPIFIDDSPILNVIELRAKARRLQSEHGLGLLVVDYLQLVDSVRKSKDSNRVQEISEISRALKATAREFNIPILALSQLSRAVELRNPKIPQLADLRESGSIEQDADVVMFIYREDYYEPKTERKNIANILLKKHRHGPIGEVELYFVPEQMKFVPIEKKRVGV